MSLYSPGPGWTDAAWWEVLGAELRAEQLTREAWIDALALAWCLVRRPDSLGPAALERQQDMVDRLTGRKYLTTVPLEGFELPVTPMIEGPRGGPTGYLMAARIYHTSAWGSGHTCSGPIHDGPCICECGIEQPYD